MALASTTTVTSAVTILLNAAPPYGTASGAVDPAVRAVHVRALSGSVDVRVQPHHGSAWVTLSAAGQELEFVATGGQAISKVEAKGTTGPAKLRFAVTGY